ncbi:MAG: GntR family transcriptional regulator [Candidatus Bipolaricaulis sp.]|nr:GntR family transcriptional regulator [Candidatus Bipolaricaulis sp.]
MTIECTWPIDMNAGPIFVQIANQVRQKLARGEIVPGDRLPSARDLAAGLGVNPNTVVHAFAELERTSVIETRRGLGTFVREDAPVAAMRRDMLLAAAAAFAADAAALGVSTSEALAALKEALHAG